MPSGPRPSSPAVSFGSAPQHHPRRPSGGQEDQNQLKQEEDDRPAVERGRASERKPDEAEPDDAQAEREGHQKNRAGGLVRADHMFWRAARERLVRRDDDA